MARKRESVSLSLACETKAQLELFRDMVTDRIDVPIHTGIIVDKIVQLVTPEDILGMILQEPENDVAPEAQPEGAR